MPPYKLYYFNAYGCVEHIRCLMALAEQEYEDYRMTTEEWPELKTKMPFGQVPVLEVEGHDRLIAQSKAILRYLGHKLGYHGNTLEDQLRVDMIVSCQEDFNKPLIKYARETDPDKKKELKKYFQEVFQPEKMEKFEKILKENRNGDGWFVGDQITIADLAYVHGTSWPDVFGFNTNWDLYPKQKALKERVENQPQIKKWMEIRPQKPY